MAKINIFIYFLGIITIFLFALIVMKSFSIASATSTIQNFENSVSLETDIQPNCDLTQFDSNFYINISQCSNSLINGTLTFNPSSSATTLTGWFNITALNYNLTSLNNLVNGLVCTANSCSVLLTINKLIIPSIPFSIDFNQLNLSFPKNNETLNLKFGLQSASVTISSTTFLRITSNDNSIENSPFYSVDIPLSASAVNTAPSGVINNLTIFNDKLPLTSSVQYRSLILNTGGIGMTSANSTIIESGGIRVLVRTQNISNNYCGNGACVNYTFDQYFYPRYLIEFEQFQANNSIGFNSISANVFYSFYTTTRVINISTNMTYNGTQWLNTTVLQGSTQFYSSFNQSVAFFYGNQSGMTNKTIFLAITTQNFTANNGIRLLMNPAINQRKDIGFVATTGGTSPSGSYGFSYLVMFGHSANSSSGTPATTIDNETIWQKDFSEFWFSYYNASLVRFSTINGTSLGFNNLTTTFNFTANVTGLNSSTLDFNLSTGFNNFTFPIFHIINISQTSNISQFVYMRNFTNSSVWINLINGTNYLLQAGNESFFRYPYTLFEFNGTLGNGTNQTYEFWISNDTTPSIPPPPSPPSPPPPPLPIFNGTIYVCFPNGIKGDICFNDVNNSVFIFKRGIVK